MFRNWFRGFALMVGLLVATLVVWELASRVKGKGSLNCLSPVLNCNIGSFPNRPSHPSSNMNG